MKHGNLYIKSYDLFIRCYIGGHYTRTCAEDG